MPKRYEWAGGYCAVWYDPDKKEIVWWGAEHPKGGHPYETRISAAHFVSSGLSGAVDDVPPDVILRPLYEDVAAHQGLPAEPVSDRLCAAARAGDLVTMRALLDGGASPDLCDLSGCSSAIEHAFQGKQDAASELLVERGAARPFWILSRALTAHAWRTFFALLKAGVGADEGTLKDSWPWLLSLAPTEVLDVIVAKVPAVRTQAWDRDKVKKRLAEDAPFRQWAEQLRAGTSS
jgi:hypothetical protein